MSGSPEQHNFIETLAREAQDRIAFDELTDLVVEVCLSDKEAFQQDYKEAQDRLVDVDETTARYRSLGMWGARTVIESLPNVDVHYEPYFEKDQTPFFWELLKDPLLLPTKFDIHAQATFEALGKSLVRESFACLGPDAIEHAEEIKAAETFEEKLPHLIWAMFRVLAIRDEVTHEDIVQQAQESPDDTAEQPEDEASEAVGIDGDSEVLDIEEDKPEDADKYFFHPARLSPKLIGEYPNNKLVPTCLGISILVAAYYEAAGLPYLHAGIARSVNEHTQLIQATLVEFVDDIAEAAHITLPDPIKVLLDNIVEAYETRLGMWRGTHAAVFVQDNGDRWALYDPNYRFASDMSDDEDKKLQYIKLTLDELAQIAPSLQISMASAVGMFANHWTQVAHDLQRNVISGEMAEYILNTAAASDDPLDCLQTYLYNSLFVERGTSGAYMEEFMLDLINVVGREKTLLLERLTQRLMKYMFADAQNNDLTKSLERYKADPSYRQRRIEDLRMMPIYAALGYVTDLLFMLEYDEPSLPSAAFEVGSPHQRIGACVMSDFASHTNEGLSQDFWLKNFPSHISIFEHLPQNPPIESRITIEKFHNLIKTSGLMYFGSYGIVQEFLEQGDGNNGPRATELR